MKFDIDYRKSENLTPDERNLSREGRIWLHAGTVEADSRREALRVARELVEAGRLLFAGGDKLRISPQCRFSR